MPALPRFGSLKHCVNSIHADARTGCASAVVAGVEEASEVCEHCGAMLVAKTRTSHPGRESTNPTGHPDCENTYPTLVVIHLEYTREYTDEYTRPT